jgi:hypothetical protein
LCAWFCQCLWVFHSWLFSVLYCVFVFCWSSSCVLVCLILPVSLGCPFLNVFCVVLWNQAHTERRPAKHKNTIQPIEQSRMNNQ